MTKVEMLVTVMVTTKKKQDVKGKRAIAKWLEKNLMISDEAVENAPFEMKRKSWPIEIQRAAYIENE